VPSSTTSLFTQIFKMVRRTVRYLVNEGCYQFGIPNTTSGIIEATLLKTPTAVIFPVGIVADAVGVVIKMCPLLGDVEVTRIPVIGERRTAKLMSIGSPQRRGADGLKLQDRS
jgi:hypothetical protein